MLLDIKKLDELIKSGLFSGQDLEKIVLLKKEIEDKTKGSEEGQDLLKIIKMFYFDNYEDLKRLKEKDVEKAGAKVFDMNVEHDRKIYKKLNTKKLGKKNLIVYDSETKKQEDVENTTEYNLEGDLY